MLQLLALQLTAWLHEPLPWHARVALFALMLMSPRIHAPEPEQVTLQLLALQAKVASLHEPSPLQFRVKLSAPPLTPLHAPLAQLTVQELPPHSTPPLQASCPQFTSHDCAPAAGQAT